MTAARERRLPPLFLALTGAAIGFVGSLCGIGGGLFAVPLLHDFGRFELKRAVATGLVLVLATTAAATVTELLGPAPELTASFVLPLAVGVLAGAQLGFATSERISTRALKFVFVFVLAYSGWKLSFEGGAETSVVVSAAHAAPWAAFVVGFGGGFVAPLLGVGGGLVLVPALVLVVGLDFAGARATSLAAGAIGASRALALHSRAGRVVWRPGLWLGAGALIGATCGVLTLADPSLLVLGRRLFGGILWFVTARFALDVFGRRKGEPDRIDPVEDQA